MRRVLLILCALLLGTAAARADSTVPAMPAATSLSGATKMYLANAGAYDNSAGLATTVFCISSGALTLCNGGVANAMLTNPSVTLNSHVLALGGTLALGFPDFSGTVAASQLPVPSATTLGGVESFAPIAHNWINTISTLGVPSGTRPATADISDIGTFNLNTTGSGTFAGALAPNGGIGGITGLILGNGATAPSAYAGTSCTAMFPRSLNASGAATCASVDLASIATIANGTILLNQSGASAAPSAVSSTALTLNLGTSGTIATSNTTASTNDTNGSGTFGGGVGIVGALNVGGAISGSSLTATGSTGLFVANIAGTSPPNGSAGPVDVLMQVPLAGSSTQLVGVYITSTQGSAGVSGSFYNPFYVKTGTPTAPVPATFIGNLVVNSCEINSAAVVANTTEQDCFGGTARNYGTAPMNGLALPFEIHASAPNTAQYGIVVNVVNSAAVGAGETINGITSESQSATGDGPNDAFSAYTFSGSASWSDGLDLMDNCCNDAIHVGLQSALSGNNIPSQSIKFFFTNGTGVKQNASIVTSSFGGVSITGTAGSNALFSVGGFASFVNGVALGGSHVVLTPSGAGAATQYVCADASGNMLLSAAAC